jgi:crossover junction endodeoxyribonuclease RuvC
MPTNRIKILAIDPGTRQLGVAVLSDGELLYYAVKTIRKRGSAGEVLSQARGVVARLIADYEPQYLAIEKTFFIQKSAALLNVTADEIKAVAKAEGLPIHEYAPTVVRKIICNSGRATKKEAAKVIASKYPELSRFLEQRTKWEELYYANMFDAVGVGLAANLELARKSS